MSGKKRRGGKNTEDCNSTKFSDSAPYRLKIRNTISPPILRFDLVFKSFMSSFPVSPTMFITRFVGIPAICNARTTCVTSLRMRSRKTWYCRRSMIGCRMGYLDLLWFTWIALCCCDVDACTKEPRRSSFNRAWRRRRRIWKAWYMRLQISLRSTVRDASMDESTSSA